MARRKDIDVLNPQEIQAIIQTFSDGSIGIRNGAIVGVIYRTGLRVSELIALRPKDFEATEGTVRVHRGKGSRARVVAIDRLGIAWVQRWLDERRRLGIGTRDPLFCSIKTRRADCPGKCERGGAMNRRYIYQFLAAAAVKADIDKRVHPHGLRHTHAFELAKEAPASCSCRLSWGTRVCR